MSQTPTKTNWTVRPAPGLEAVLCVGILAGDALQSEIFAAEREEIWHQLSAAAQKALSGLDREMRVGLKKLVGPVLAHMLSAGPDSTLTEIIAGASDPYMILEPTLRIGPGWEPTEAKALFDLMPLVTTALVGLREAGFESWFNTRFRPKIDEVIVPMRDGLGAYDIVPLLSRLLGRSLLPIIEINPTYYSKPYGIRVAGQRFLAHYQNETENVLRIAAHELFHPPFERSDRELFASMADLEADPWMHSIVENHDPAFGYNSFESLVDEDSTQALDQIVSEQLGVARDPGDRWRRADGGMHLLAAALYHAMISDGFVERGGTYSDWLKAAVGRGMLTPDEVRRRAGAVVGEESVQRWQPNVDVGS